MDAGGDAFITKLSAGGKILWSTYFGARYGANANAVGVDNAGNVIVAGTTYSQQIPMVNA